MNLLKNTLGVITLFAILFVSACKEDPELPDNLVEFESDELGIAEDESELTININLFREAEKDAEITLQYEATGLTYGTDFTTEPAASGSNITIPVVKGATSVSFKVKKSVGVLLDGDEELSITITGVPNSLELGEKLTLSLSFDEIVAASGTMIVNGGGTLYPNKVFIDLSANRQTAIERTTWDLGFSTGSNFRVTLNSPNGAMARALDKNDLNAVTAADTAGWGKQLSVAAIATASNVDFPAAWLTTAINWIDDPMGDITKTAIAEISATASDNMVYIINRGTGPGTPANQRGWKKIRVNRNGSGYTLQYADIAATTFSEIQVTKEDGYAFKYVNLTTGVVSVEPAVAKWDIAWNGFTNTFPTGVDTDNDQGTPNVTTLIPYYFQDVIVQNMTGVETVQVLTATKAYDDFAEVDLTGLAFGAQTQLKIGTSWRFGVGFPPVVQIRTDRFYVIKDAANNYYKLKFTSLGTERGKPEIAFSLIKKGI